MSSNRQDSLDRLINQNFREEFRDPGAPPSPSPPPPPPQNQFGSVGDKRHGAHHHLHQPGSLWVLPLIVERAPAPPPVAPPPPEPARRSRTRSMCCSYCYNRAARWARLDGVAVPSRNDRGSWSDHSLKGPGPNRVVTCPVLRNVVCGHCGATGDHAHTTKHNEEHPEDFN